MTGKKAWYVDVLSFMYSYVCSACLYKCVSLLTYSAWRGKNMVFVFAGMHNIFVKSCKLTFRFKRTRRLNVCEIWTSDSRKDREWIINGGNMASSL